MPPAIPYPKATCVLSNVALSADVNKTENGERELNVAKGSASLRLLDAPAVSGRRCAIFRQNPPTVRSESSVEYRDPSEMQSEGLDDDECTIRSIDRKRSGSAQNSLKCSSLHRDRLRMGYVPKSYSRHGFFQADESRRIYALPFAQRTPGEPLSGLFDLPLESQNQRRIFLDPWKRIDLHCLERRDLIDNTLQQVETEPLVGVLSRSVSSEAHKNVHGWVQFNENLERPQVDTVRQTELRLDVLTSGWLCPAWPESQFDCVDCSSVPRGQPLEKRLLVVEEASMARKQA